MRKPTTALPRWLQHGLDRAERERKANVIARPMRNLMDMLKQGEVYEIEGRAVMRAPAGTASRPSTRSPSPRRPRGPPSWWR